MVKKLKEALVKKIIVVYDEEVGVKEGKVSGTKTDERKMQSKEEEATSPKVDIRTLPFLQKYIRRSVDKQFGKFLDKSPFMHTPVGLEDLLRV